MDERDHFAKLVDLAWMNSSGVISERSMIVLFFKGYSGRREGSYRAVLFSSIRVIRYWCGYEGIVMETFIEFGSS
ncbi:hypothetical protein [Sutcliffiella halmapala]|uniref:hypothetical protein n=1 Tax=Sutcliffiella halmapala TaxID=79882 RepID=UPI0009949CD8|nr:hypothetical protein [Sutcliffiella halmapala]